MFKHTGSTEIINVLEETFCCDLSVHIVNTSSAFLHLQSESVRAGKTSLYSILFVDEEAEDFTEEKKNDLNHLPRILEREHQKFGISLGLLPPILVPACECGSLPTMCT